MCDNDRKVMDYQSFVILQGSTVVDLQYENHQYNDDNSNIHTSDDNDSGSF